MGTQERMAKRAVELMPPTQRRTIAHSTCLQFLKDLYESMLESIFNPVKLQFITKLVSSKGTQNTYSH